MTAADKAALERYIAEATTQTRSEIEQLEQKLAPVEPDCSLGRLTRMEAMGEQQVYQQTLEEARRRLNRLQFALTRIDSETFGICESCEEPIAIERLKIMPETTLCVSCANERGR